MYVVVDVIVYLLNEGKDPLSSLPTQPDIFSGLDRVLDAVKDRGIADKSEIEDVKDIFRDPELVALAKVREEISECSSILCTFKGFVTSSHQHHPHPLSPAPSSFLTLWY